MILEPERYRWLLGLHALDVDSQRMVHAARTTSMGVALSASERGLDDLLKYVGAEANDEPNRRRRPGLDERRPSRP